MANLVDNSGDATSNLVAGTGTTSAVFTMPGSVALNVESVVASISNGGASAATPKITIKDQSGVVIATNAQDDAIPAGDTGTATFALRLGGGKGGIRFGKANVGNFLDVTTTGTSAGWGIQFFSTGPVLYEGSIVDIESDAGDVNITSAQDLNESVAQNFVNITNGSYSVDAANIGLHAAAGDIALGLEVGGNVTVLNHLGQPIFRVDEDGDLHGLTGKALVFDL